MPFLFKVNNPPTGPQWITTYFDNTYWFPNVGTWNGSAWASDGATLSLEPFGTGWPNGPGAQNFRPSKIRCTVVAGAPPLSWVQIYDGNVDVIGAGAPYNSLDEITLTFNEPYDIIALYAFDGSDFTVTSIEFLL